MRPAALASPSSLAALRHHNFRLWAAADLVSTVGTWMQLVAQNWLVLQITHSPAMLGLTLTLQSAPTIAGGMWAGSLVDRLPKRPMLVATQGAFGVLAAALALATASGHATNTLVWVLAVLTGVVNAVSAPAVASFCAEVVGPDDLGNAIAIGAATNSTGRILGMALAGGIVAAAGAQTAFAINAASFIVVVAALLLMRPHELRPLRRAADGEKGVWRGLRYVARQPRLLGLFAVCFVLGAFGRNFQVTMAAMADGPLHAGASGYGIASTMFAVGTLAGAAVAAGQRRLGRRVLLVAGAGASALQMVSSAAPTLAAFACLMAPIAVGAVVVDSASGFLAQSTTDEAMRGRVVAVAGLVGAASGAIGGPVLGWLAVACGARASLLVGGLVALAVATLALWWTEALPALRRPRADRRPRRRARPLHEHGGGVVL